MSPAVIFGGVDMPYVNGVDLTPGSKITANGEQAAAIADHADPAAATVSDVATKQNQILAVLRSLGMIAES